LVTKATVCFAPTSLEPADEVSPAPVVLEFELLEDAVKLGPLGAGLEQPSPHDMAAHMARKISRRDILFPWGKDLTSLASEVSDFSLIDNREQVPDFVVCGRVC
jgi:hypothetical protein